MSCLKIRFLVYAVIAAVASGCSGPRSFGSALPGSASNASQKAYSRKLSGGHQMERVGEPRVPVIGLRKANGFPITDPRLLSRTQAERNPPSDASASAEFIRNRDHGIPAIFRVAADRVQRGSRARSNLVINADPGQTGTYMDLPTTAYTGFRGNHTAWTALEFGYNQVQSMPLYAPTAHPPNSCLEIGTRYFPPSFGPDIYAFDFCNDDPKGAKDPDGRLIGSFTSLFSVNLGFRNSWEAEFGDGVPVYSFQILRNPDGRDTVLLFQLDPRSMVRRIHER